MSNFEDICDPLCENLSTFCFLLFFEINGMCTTKIDVLIVSVINEGKLKLKYLIYTNQFAGLWERKDMLVCLLTFCRVSKSELCEFVCVAVKYCAVFNHLAEKHKSIQA